MGRAYWSARGRGGKPRSCLDLREWGKLGGVWPHSSGFSLGEEDPGWGKAGARIISRIHCLLMIRRRLGGR